MSTYNMFLSRNKKNTDTFETTFCDEFKINPLNAGYIQ